MINHNSNLAVLQVIEFVDRMSSPTTSPILLLDDIYNTSLEPLDPNNKIDNHNFCELLDLMDPLTDWQADSFESVAVDYHFSCLPPSCSNDHASLDLLLQSQMGIDNWKPSIISVSTEGIHSNWNGLGLSFHKKRNSAFVEWKAMNPCLPCYCKSGVSVS